MVPVEPTPPLDVLATSQTPQWALIEALLGAMPYVSRQGAGINQTNLPGSPEILHENPAGMAYPGRVLARPSFHDAIRCIPAEPATSDVDWIIIPQEIAAHDDPITAIRNLYQRISPRGGFLIATLPTVATHADSGRREGVQYATWEWWRAKFMKADGGTGFTSKMAWQPMVELALALRGKEDAWGLYDTFVIELRPRSREEAARTIGASIEDEGLLSKARRIYAKLATIFPAMP